MQATIDYLSKKNDDIKYSDQHNQESQNYRQVLSDCLDINLVQLIY